MKLFLITLAVTIVSLYTIIAFISFLPNPSEWGSGNRGAFAIASLIISSIASAIQESSNDKK
jgi:hypothetical protein